MGMGSRIAFLTLAAILSTAPAPPPGAGPKKASQTVVHSVCGKRTGTKAKVGDMYWCRKCGWFPASEVAKPGKR